MSSLVLLPASLESLSSCPLSGLVLCLHLSARRRPPLSSCVQASQLRTRSGAGLEWEEEGGEGGRERREGGKRTERRREEVGEKVTILFPWPRITRRNSR